MTSMIQLTNVVVTEESQIRQKIAENPDKVFFPNFGDGDNILKEGITIDRVMFTIPGTDIKIYWYGFIIALGVLLAMIYGFKKMRPAGIDPDRGTDVVIGGFIGGILGARLYYILFDSELGFKDFFNIRNGGLAIYGGIIGAILVGAIVAKIRKLKVVTMLDVAAPCFLIGQCIGRWGNFFNQEAFGTNTDLPWGMLSFRTASFIANHDLVDQDPYLPVHPCFLYESIWCLIGFILLHFYFKHRKFDGEVFLMYIGWYGLGRFFIEGLRTDSLYIGQIRVSQLVAGTCFLTSIVLIIIFRGITARSDNYKFFYETELSKVQLREYDLYAQMILDKKELKTKIKRAKARGESFIEYEKEYEEKFGKKSGAKRKEAIKQAQQQDRDRAEKSNEEYQSILSGVEDDDENLQDNNIEENKEEDENGGNN